MIMKLTQIIKSYNTINISSVLRLNISKKILITVSFKKEIS